MAEKSKIFSIQNGLLSRRYWVLPVAFLGLIIGLSLYNSINNIQKYSRERATEGARNMVEAIKMTRLWSSLHGDIYTPFSENIFPEDIADDAEKPIETREGLKLSKVNPASMVRQIDTIAADRNISFNLTSLQPKRAQNLPDPWEKGALLQFQQGGALEYQEAFHSADPPVFRYMSALEVKEPCLRCHAEQGYKLGDIRGGISITLPSRLVFEQDGSLIRNEIIKHLAVFVFLSGLVLMFLQQTRRQWMKLDRIRREQASVIDERTSHLQESNALLQQENSERQQAENKYRAVSQAAYDAIVATDSDGSVTSWNPGAERIFGYTEGEVLGKPVTMLMPKEYRKKHRQNFTKIADSGKFKGIGNALEVLGLRRNGDVFPIEVSVGAWKNEGQLRFTVVIRDITERKNLEQEQRLAATVFASTAEGLIITDSEHRIVAVNPAFVRITGYTEEDVLGKSPELLNSGKHEDKFYADIYSCLEESGHWHGEIWSRRKNNETYPALVSVSAVKGSSGTTTHFVGAFSDISMIKDSQEKLEFLANHDPLTNMPNRRLFMERLGHVLIQAYRNPMLLAVLFIDLDHFKTVNDSLGHHIGDLLLQAVAKRMSSVLRDDDTVARLGGDEFTILLEHLHHTDDAVVVVHKLMESFKKPFTVAEHVLFVTPSIGISMYPDDGCSPEMLLKGADSAMYKAKEKGRNQYHFYSEDLTSKAMERLQIETNLHQALSKGEFIVYYQPQIDLRTRKITGAEALLRWEHSELGLVSPAKFMPSAEDTGLIVEIGEWVLLQACRQAVEWIEASPDFKSISVNISGKQIQHPDFVRQVKKAIEETGIRPETLELEIAENFIMSQAEHAIAVLDELRRLNVRLAIDDFGTGYSSLNYLKRFPIDTLKIDQSFIRGLPDDANDVAIARAVIALGQSLNLLVVAEGVETEEQLQLLLKEGCDQAQGYYFKRPVPPGELVFQ